MTASRRTGVLYEVNIEVDASAHEEYRAWLRDHIAEILALPGFTGAKLFEVLDPPASAKELEVAFAPREPVNLNVKQGDPAPVARKAAGPTLRPAAEPAAPAPAPALAPVEAQPLPPGSPDALPTHD